MRPRYAVPFASNHCHLHRDTRHLNAYIQTPLDVAAYFERFRTQQALATRLEVMLPGSSWSEDAGFDLADTGVFAERDRALQRYSNDKAATLESYYALERKVRVTTEDMVRFFGVFFNVVPGPLRLLFRSRRILMVCEGGASPGCWWIDMWTRRVQEAAPEDVEQARLRVHIPAIVLRQSLRMNMFAHAGISKRVRFLATRTDMRYLRLFEFLLECYEVELLPLRQNLTRRSLRSWARRWREPVLYLQIAWLLLIGHNLIEIEQTLLRKRRRRASEELQRVCMCAGVQGPPSAAGLVVHAPLNSNTSDHHGIDCPPSTSRRTGAEDLLCDSTHHPERRREGGAGAPVVGKRQPGDTVRTRKHDFGADDSRSGEIARNAKRLIQQRFPAKSRR